MPLTFSIVTPVLNGMPDVQRCVGSVRAQRRQDAEHIVYDACSTDGTTEWLEGQPDLSVQSEPDEGMYDAINKGWCRSKGNILSWLNADEQYLPGTLDTVEQCFNVNPKIDALFADAIFVDSDGYPIAARREIPLRKTYVANGFLYALSCTVFFRRRLLDEGLLRFDPRLRTAGDMDLVLRLLNQGCRFIHIPQYLSLFGIGDANASASSESISETSLVRDKYSCFRSPFARKLMVHVRHLEKLIAGCYFKDMVRYKYAVNECPEYVTYSCNRVSPFFRYDPHSHRKVRGDD